MGEPRTKSQRRKARVRTVNQRKFLLHDAMVYAQQVSHPIGDLHVTDPTQGIANVMAWIEAILTWAQTQVGALKPGVAKSPTDAEQYLFHHAWDAHGNLVVEKHHLLVLVEEMSDRLFNMQQRCVQLGIEERRVRIAEAQSVQLGRALGRALESVALDAGVKAQIAVALERALNDMRANPPLLEAA